MSRLPSVRDGRAPSQGMIFSLEQSGIAKDQRIEVPEPSTPEDFDAVEPTLHKDEVQLHIEIAQDAIKTWMALQEPDSREALLELVAPDLVPGAAWEHWPGKGAREITGEELEDLMISVRL